MVFYLDINQNFTLYTIKIWKLLAGNDRWCKHYFIVLLNMIFLFYKSKWKNLYGKWKLSFYQVIIDPNRRINLTDHHSIWWLLNEIWFQINHQGVGKWSQTTRGGGTWGWVERGAGMWLGVGATLLPPNDDRLTYLHSAHNNSTIRGCVFVFSFSFVLLATSFAYLLCLSV